jgi:superfamily II DNA helicase RecQ
MALSIQWNLNSGTETAVSATQCQTTQHQDSDNNANKLLTGEKLTIENAGRFLKYEEDFGVLICAVHGYAVRNLENHLRVYHLGSKKEKKAVLNLYKNYDIREPTSVPLPPPLQEPFAALGKPKKAYICDEPECEEISINRNCIRIHCNKAHDWESTEDEREHWHQVWVQTFFSAAGLQRYFTVDYKEPDDHEESVDGISTVGFEHEIVYIMEEWDKAVENNKKKLDIVDAEVAKTDRTAWFKRTGWTEHLARSNMRHLSKAIRMPGRDEIVLQRAVVLVDSLVERAVSGLSTLDQESRRWLRSAKQSEPDVRPLARLQNPDSQSRYVGYIKKCVCYCMRVYRSVELFSALEEDDISTENSESEVSDESGDESDHSSHDDPATTGDVLYDARRLFPWQDDFKERTKKLWDVIESGGEDEVQLGTLLEFFKSLIFQHVRGDTFKSCLIHFLAVLGIDDETGRLRQANDYSYMLAGVVYCVRVLAAEILLPSGTREQQGDEDDRKFRRLRDEYLADGSYSVMSKMISLLAYGKNLALNHGNAGAVLWSKDGKTMSLRGKPIVVAQFTKMIHNVIGEAEYMLWQKLMWTRNAQRFEIALDKLEDDVTWTKRGVSFIGNQHNKLDDNRKWMLQRAQSDKIGRKMFVDGVWVMGQVRAYLREIDKFRELLLLVVHLTGGQPARGTEITTVRFKNGFLQDRNIFAIHGHMVVVTRYHKSQSQFDKPKVIPRFLPWSVGQLLAVYLAYVQPLQECLSVQVKGSGWSDYVWSNEQGPWETDRLTKVIARETQKRLGVRLTTHDYRHTAISIGRRVVGEQFAHGYAEEMAEIEEPEVETDDALELSAGRGGEVGANRYGVSLDVIKHLSSRTVDTFRPLSEKWHKFLGLSSYGDKGQKRSREERSNSALDQQNERRMAVMLKNNGIGNWEAAMARYNPQSQTSEAETSGWWFGQSSQALSSLANEVDEGERLMQKAVRKVLQCEDFSFKSTEQEDALRTIMLGEHKAPLGVVLPTGGGKSLLFMAPACIDNPGVTIVVVPYRALINNLVATATRCGIDCMEWRVGEVNPAALVFVSADSVPFSGFLGYGKLLESKGLLRRIFVDESHLTFTSSDWRPKLAEVRAVRGLRCPTILLTATLPPVLEFELEASMAAEMAKYIRSRTTRARTRYIVQTCTAGTVEDEAVALCRRMQKHLGWKKGVVYNRSRVQCERVAQELGCAYYHAGAVDNEERLQTWLEQGGLIAATSALGTGVDFPGIVFVMHIDLPYGMIDYAQESGRAGRAGEDVDSVIMIEDKRVERMSGTMRGVDDSVMGEFATTRECRRGVMSSYLDGQKIECGDGDGEMAQCDRCGEGLTALERTYRRAATERQLVEETLDEIVDGCAACWAMARKWTHIAVNCTQREDVSASRCDELREMIGYEASSHSCHRCGISQKLCATGRDSKAKCQWSNVLVPILRGLMLVKSGMAVLSRLGFEGDEADWVEYGRWLGLRHRRRIWGELMSNAMAVAIEVVVERAQQQQEEEVGFASVMEELEVQLSIIRRTCRLARFDGC